MGLLDLFRPKAASGAIDTTAAASFLVGGTQQGQGPAWPEDNYDSFAREGYGRSELVYACIQEIATSSAEGRLTLARQTADGTEEVETGALAERLRYPNESMEQFEFLEALNCYLDIAGNAYVFKERGRVRQVTGLYLLRPDRMRIIPGPKVPRGYVYQVEGVEYLVAADDIGHLKLFNPFSDHYGLSPLHVLAKMVNLDQAQTDFTKVFFQNAGVPSGLLKVKRKLQSQDEANAIRTRWRSQFQGVRNWHRIAVLDEDAEYQQMASNLKEMELPDLRNLTESRICMAFGVPPILVGANVGLQRSTFANYAEARTAFWEETLLPRNKRVRGGLRRTLAAEFSELSGDAARLEWDYGDVKALQENEDATAARVTALYLAGLLLRDEARAALKYDPAPPGLGGVFVVPSGVTFEGPDAPEPEPVPPALAASATDQPAPQLPPGQPAKDYGAPETKISARQRRLLERLRAEVESVTDLGTRVLDTFFGRLRSRADGVMGRHMSAGMPTAALSGKSDGYPFSAEDLIPDGADGELAHAWRPLTIDITVAAWEAVNESGILGDVPFDQAEPAVVRLLTDAGARIVQINETTRQGIAEALRLGVSRGYSIQQLANGVPGDGFPGVRSLIHELYRNRARAIARTEVGTSQNHAAAARYRVSGVTHVDVMDGDEDAPCAAVNGTRQTVEWAAEHPLEHPNCTRAMLPVVEIPALSREPVEARR